MIIKHLRKCSRNAPAWKNSSAYPLKLAAMGSVSDGRYTGTRQFALTNSNLTSTPNQKLHTVILPVDPKIITFESSLDNEKNQNAHPFFKPVMHIPKSETLDSIRLAAESLRTTCNPVAFPTETVYGIGADVRKEKAINNIFRIKNRPNDNPLIIHVASIQQIFNLFRNQVQSPEGIIPPIYFPLIDKFWPGPLSIILPNRPALSDISQSVTADQNTIAVRMPNHPVALALILMSNTPLAAPSANLSSYPSPTTAQHVYHDLEGRIQYILDSGPCNVGLESTVVDGTVHPPLILRPGGVTLEQIRECGHGWELVEVAQPMRSVRSEDNLSDDMSCLSNNTVPRAPGMKYRHYSPNALVVLCEGLSPSEVIQKIQINHKILERCLVSSKFGIFTTKTWDENVAMQEFSKLNSMAQVFELGKHSGEISQKIFAALRQFDEDSDAFEYTERSVSPTGSIDNNEISDKIVFVEAVGEDGEGLALMNRLRKAASYYVSGRGVEEAI